MAAVTIGSRTTSDVKSDTEPPCLIQEVFKTNQTHPGYALVIEPTPCMATALQDLGWRCDSYHPRSVIQASDQQIGGWIREGKYNLVWIRFPWKHVLPKERVARFEQQSKSWLHLAGQHRILAIHCKQVAECDWGHDECFMKDKFTSQHHLCHYGIRLVGTEPSGIIYHLLTTKKLPSHGCAHPGKQHALDRELLTGKLGANSARIDAERNFCKQLMMELCKMRDLFACFDADGSRALKSLNQSRKPDCCNGVATHCGTMAEQQDHRHQKVQEGSNQPIQNFPTESAIAGKEHKKKLKLEGKTPKRKLRILDDHWDDLGDDLSGLGEDSAFLMLDYVPHKYLESSDDSTDEEFAHGMETQFFYGESHARPLAPHALRFNNWQAALSFLNSQEAGLDLCELCGGPEARTSQVAIRRRLKTGHNFDLVCDVDLGDPMMQTAVAHYINDNNVMVVIMAPSCRAIGPTSKLNYRINPEGWAKSFDADLPHLEFCGRMAILQERKGRFWFAETSFPTWLWTLREWQHVALNPNTKKEVIHQCTLGVKGPNGLLVKKATEVSSNAPELINQFVGLKCTGLHEHDDMWGKPQQLRQLQVWSWSFCARLIQGVIDLKKRLRHQLGRRAYTAYKGTFPCIGCDSNLPCGRTEHNRVNGECKFHNTPADKIEPEYTCPGCTRKNPDGKIRPRPRGHSDHTMDPTNCRMPATTERRFSNRARASAHPREGRVPASEDPDGNATTRDFGDTDDTIQIPPDTEDKRPHVNKFPADTPGSASSGGPAAGIPGGRAPRSDAGVPRGPVVREFADGTDDSPSDWTRFSVDRSLRVLKAGSEEQRRKELRKLHLRWWHAPRKPMENILKAGGVDEHTISWIPEIIDTCRACRPWQKHKDAPQTTIDLPSKQNESIEADIMYYKSFHIWHMIDKADRWHNGVEVKGKSSPELQDAIATTWLQIFGPFKTLIIDGEKGISSKETVAFLKSFGCNLHERAKEQHARVIERRGAMLRHTMHCTEEQLIKEGILWTFTILLAHCIFAGNALTNVGGSTPYISRFGSTPAMMPDLDAPQEDGIAGAGRTLQRIRQVSLQKMIEATALAKINRALNSKTSASGEQLDFKPGELVDHYSTPSQKDISGWRGPAKVIRTLDKAGIVEMEWMNTTIRRPFTSVRRFMDFSGLAHFGHLGEAYPAMNALQYVAEYVALIPQGEMNILGYKRTDQQELQLTKESTTQLLSALHFIVDAILQLYNVQSVRAARGVKYFGKVARMKSSIIMWWHEEIEQYHIYEAEQADLVFTKYVVGDDWKTAKYLQFLSTTEGIDLAQALEECQDIDTTSNISGGADASGRTDLSDPDRLSTIDEATGLFLAVVGDGIPGTNGTGSGCPPWCDADLWESLEHQQQCFLQHLHKHDDVVIEEVDPIPLEAAPRKSLPEVTIDDIYAVYHTFGADTSYYGAPETDEHGNTYHEIEFPDHTAKLILDTPPPPGYTAKLRVYEAVKRAVVEREDDTLTQDELIKHKTLVLSGIREELISWIKHECFVRKPRRISRNILDVRWVAKWKFVKAETVAKGYAKSQDHSTAARADGKVRVIRMRMTLRGFKDWDALMLETYSGTAKRLSQKLVASEAATRGWAMAAIDVRKAFLKGISYDDLAKETGEPRRDVSFELSEEACAVLCTLEGYEDFDWRTEVLHCVRPGTGCKDAPRCWSINLTKVTQVAWGAKPTTHDDHLLVRHEPSSYELDFIATEHVDDIKSACEIQTLKQFILCLEQAFGKGELEITVENFDCCGMRHQITDQGYELDQIEYLSKLKPITNAELTAGKDDDPADAINAKLFLSLVMAMAFGLMTRWDLHVYITALQRWLQAPCYRHLRKINTIVRFAQKNPKKLLYRWMSCSQYLECHSDAGFRREEDKEGLLDGRSARGANFLRMGVDSHGDASSCHWLDTTVGMTKVAVRSTFTSETHGVIATADSAIVLAMTLHEIRNGPLAVTDAKRLCDEAGLCYRISVVTDAKNLLSALQVAHLKIPAEKNFIVHLMWLKDKLTTGVLDSLIWTDTRDMTADGHTKGSIKRTALHQLMDGKLVILHERETLQLHKPKPVDSNVAQASRAGASGTPAATAPSRPVARQPASRRPAKAILLALLASMAAGLPQVVLPDLGLGPRDNPFALLGLRRTSVTAAMKMENSDFERAYRKATLVLHPDKVKDKTDQELIALDNLPIALSNSVKQASQRRL